MKKQAKKSLAIIIVLILLIIVAFSLLKPTTSQAIFSGIIVTYDDGTSVTYTSNSQQLSIYDPYNGRTIVSLSTIVSVNAIYSGTIQFYTFTGDASFILCNPDKSYIANFGTQSLTTTGSSLTSGQQVQIISSSASASNLNTLINQNVGNPINRYFYFRLHAETSMRLTLTFSPDNIQTLEVNIPDAYWYFQVR